MAKKQAQKLEDITLGPLPVEGINATLDTELEPGDVVLSVAAQKHAQRRHPNEYAQCLPHVGGVVTNPLYVGDDFRNPGKIELVSRLPVLGGGLLVAVSLERDEQGRYGIASFYPVTQAKIDKRRLTPLRYVPRRK